MSYYLRYLITSDKHLTLPAIHEALKRIDERYAVQDDMLTFADAEYAQLEINLPGDEVFEEELEELIEAVRATRQKNRRLILERLGQTRATLAVQAIYEGRSSEETLEKLDPLWSWMVDEYEGLLQVDGEGFYLRSALLLRLQ